MTVLACSLALFLQAATASPAREPAGYGATSPAGADAPQAGPSAGALAEGAQKAAGGEVTSYPASFFAGFQASTAFDLIGRLPGFAFDPGSTVRGFAGAAGNVLIDGVRPTSKSDSLQAILSRIPASTVVRIDIIRGGAPGIDMQGKTVLANVIRKPAGSSTVITVQNRAVLSDGQSVPFVQATTTQHLGDKLLEGSLLATRLLDTTAGDGPETRTDAHGAISDRLQDNTKADGARAVGTAAMTAPAWGGKLKLNTRLYYNHYLGDEVDKDAVDPSLQPSIEHDADVQENGEIGLTYDRALGRKLSLDLLAVQQVSSEDALTLYSAPSDLERYREQHTNGESIVSLRATYVSSPSLTFEAGGEGDYNWLKSRTVYAVNDIAQVVPAGRVYVTEARGELFAKATWSASPQLSIELGARIEASHIASAEDVRLAKSLVYPKPRAVFTWSPDRNDQVRIRLEREVSQLDFSDFVSSASLITGQVFSGNPNLVPQQSNVIEAAYERHFLGSGDLTFTYRHSQLSDVIDRAPVLASSGAFDAPANIGRGREDEFVLGLTFPLDKVGLSGALIKANTTWRSSSVTDPTTDSRRPISAVRPREGEIDFSDDIKPWKITWGLTYNLGYSSPYYRFSQVEIDTAEPYASAFVEYKPRGDLDLRAELNSIGNDWARDLSVYPGLRSSSLLAYHSRRDLRLGPILFLRIRKTI